MKELQDIVRELITKMVCNKTSVNVFVKGNAKSPAVALDTVKETEAKTNQFIWRHRLKLCHLFTLIINKQFLQRCG